MDIQKTPSRIALVDGNSFYCSCERVLQPQYAQRPLVVLSNNDGCAIARTAEAKALGIRMGAPWFQIQHLVQQHGLIVRSANFSLYGDISQRMMSIFSQFTPHQEIYSIDESFLDLSGQPQSGRELGLAIQQRTWRWIGIPTSVGIGTTKTLAKVANHLAKQLPRLQGVCDLSPLDPPALWRALRHVAVGDVWGIGHRLGPKLHALGIHTAADLAQTSSQWLQRRFSIVLAQTAQELAGVPCLDLDVLPAPRQQVMCSRSFGDAVYTKADLAQALATFTTRAAEKLRLQHSQTQAVYVFIRSGRYHNGPPYAGSLVVPLLHPTQSTLQLLRVVHHALDRIYQPGIRYAKAGVCLLELSPYQPTPRQGQLFSTQTSCANSHHKLMQTLDQINLRYGQNRIGPASTLVQRPAPWQMRQHFKSPNFTTDWNQLAILNCN
ncbi:MAG TPA: Y-family DNA polymerase [Paenalcaligenes hominis]|uniref:Y-family DNA polymerase n=1 Tax=Paenalcaligenes hominis TaxID=643674 RepID=A0A9D2VEH7_9BURK|nr:Y-family DNA polymerase [Paenalcaligenes hominis]